MARESSNLFPLAREISKNIADATTELVSRGGGLFATEVTSTTAELLRYWFQQDFCALRPANFHDGQRDAILAVIYAHEVLGATNVSQLYETLDPSRLLDDEVLSQLAVTVDTHPKYAAKMATGTGKTWVLNALLIWQYLNSLSSPDNTRFSKNFLLVAPGLIVYERLLDSFEGRFVNGVREFETGDIYANRDLFVPDTYRNALYNFLRSSVVEKLEIGRKVTGSGLIAITNWHLLAGEEDPDFLPEETMILNQGIEFDVRDLADELLPLTPGTAAGNSLEVLDRRFERGSEMDYLLGLSSLVVFNDEAHHIHTVKKGGAILEVEWQKSLRVLSASKPSKFLQIDFSATPYNEVSSRGNKVKQYFPHIVVDFDITEAMRKGLVKTLALDKRKEVAALPLDFKVERDESGGVRLSEGQRVMLRAGLAKLGILEDQFAEINPGKHPKMMVVCEDTTVVPLVEEFLLSEGLDENDVLSIHSGKKAELGPKEWEEVRERLFSIDLRPKPKVIISVLMLREGFDVSNICVIVPLRAAGASILLEQTVGRGLRLMWRGDSQVDEEKAANRGRVAQGLEPSSYLDMLFVVEHPAFQAFYDELMAEGLVAEIGDDETTRAIGEIERVGLRAGFDQFDFEIPQIIRDAEEEIRAPTVDPLLLAPSSIPLKAVKAAIGKGDQFTSQELRSGTQFGDYRVDGGVMTATGYNDFLSRLATRISEAHGRSFVGTNQQYRKLVAFPLAQIYKPLLIGWIDTYIRQRLFDCPFDPFLDENWRVLLVPGVAESMAGKFGTLLVELQENVPVAGAEISHRWVSEVDELMIRTSSAVTVQKCIYTKLPVAAQGGGLERDFISWADRDSHVESLLKIHEYKHDFLRRPYLKADGTPAQYSPDFLVRTSERIYLVETKNDSGLSDENVQRKMRSAVSWCEQINALEASQRSNRTWHYVLAGESSMRSHLGSGETCSAYLEIVRLFADVNPENSKLF